MARRNLLTTEERRRLFQPWVDELSLISDYTLSPDDLQIVGNRRGAANHLGIAVHIALLRQPGFGLRWGEAVPAQLLTYLASQLVVSPDIFADYGHRLQTRTDHSAMVADYLGLRTFLRADVPLAIDLAARAAARSDRGETIARIIMDGLKTKRFILPSPDTVERAGLAGRARARKQSAAELVAELDPQTLERLDRLLENDPEHGVTPLA